MISKQEQLGQIFPIPTDRFSPLVQRYIIIAEQLPIPQKTRFNLVIFAIFCFGSTGVLDVKGPRDIALNLGLSEQDVFQAIKTIVNSDDDNWDSFEKLLSEQGEMNIPNRHVINEVKASRRENFFNQIVALRKQKIPYNEIGKILGLSSKTVRVYYSIGKKGFNSQS